MIVFEIAPKTTCKGPYLKGLGLISFLKYYATPGHAPLGQSNVMFSCFKAYVTVLQGSYPICHILLGTSLE